MRRGQRKHKCGECGTTAAYHWIEKTRAARMRCIGCGSTRLEIVSEEGKKDALQKQLVAVEGHRDMTRAAYELDSHRKVVG